MTCLGGAEALYFHTTSPLQRSVEPHKLTFTKIVLYVHLYAEFVDVEIQIKTS